MVAALALNGGVIALLVALPATQLLRPDTKPLITYAVPPQPTPDEIKPDPVVEKKIDPLPTAHPTKPDEDDFVIPRPIIPTIGEGLLGGTEDILPPPLKADPLPPPPKPEPVFKAARQDPRYAAAFHPDYPPALVREGLEGSVTVRVTIDEKGRVIACALVKATDKAFYEETRQQALRYWRFLPATRDGAPVQSEQMLTVTFQLNE
jgi:protein TonB